MLQLVILNIEKNNCQINWQIKERGNMSIKANINTDSHGNIIVHMSGGFEYDTSCPLRQELVVLAEKNPKSTLTLDLHHVDFVGSSGIGQFVETLNYLLDNKLDIKLINVKPEFQRVFKLYQLDKLEEMLSDFEVDKTEDLGLWGGRRRTFEN